PNERRLGASPVAGAPALARNQQPRGRPAIAAAAGVQQRLHAAHGPGSRRGRTHRCGASMARVRARRRGAPARLGGRVMSNVVRTALFVPASRPERVPKPLASGAGTGIVALEAAVEHLAKASAREALCDFLGTQPGVRLWVRINDASTPWHDDDLAACRNHPGVTAIVLPKAET